MKNNVLEVVFGNSCYHTMKNSRLGENSILLFNGLLNVGDLSLIKNNKIIIPDSLINEEGNYIFNHEITVINEAIENNKTIRIWSSHYNIYAYLMMLYVISIVGQKGEIIVTFSDEYYIFPSYSQNNKYYISPSLMREEELELLCSKGHVLDSFSIDNYILEWNKLVLENSEMRVIDNGIGKSVGYDYYDEFILDRLKELGRVRVVQLVASLMGDVYLLDNLYVYLIDRLIDEGKIKVLSSKDRFFDLEISIS